MTSRTMTLSLKDNDTTEIDNERNNDNNNNDNNDDNDGVVTITTTKKITTTSAMKNNNVTSNDIKTDTSTATNNNEIDNDLTAITEEDGDNETKTTIPKSYIMKDIYTKYDWPLTLQRCNIQQHIVNQYYTYKELEQVEIFVHKAISEYHYSNDDEVPNTNNGSNNNTTKNQHKSYNAIIETLRDRNNTNYMLLKLLIALRTGGNGITLQLITTQPPPSNNTTSNIELTHQQKIIKEQNRLNKHSRLIHQIVKFIPFHLDTKENDYEYMLHIADAYFHLIIALVSSNAIFLLPVLNSLWNKCTTEITNLVDSNNNRNEITFRYHATLTKIFYLISKASTELITIMIVNTPLLYNTISSIVYYYQQCFILCKYYDISIINSKSSFINHKDESIYYYIPRSTIYKLMIDLCIELDVTIKLDNNIENNDENENDENNKEVEELLSSPLLQKDNIVDTAAAVKDDAEEKAEKEKKKPNRTTEFNKQQHDMILKLDSLLYLLMEETEDYCLYNPIHDPRLRHNNTKQDVEVKVETEPIPDGVLSATPDVVSSAIITNNNKTTYHNLNRNGAKTIKQQRRRLREIFDILFSVFKTNIIMTHQTKFVQFLLLHICGYEIQLLSSSTSTYNNNGTNRVLLYRLYATKLIDIILDPSRSIMIRQTASCYLASFISRAQYVCTETAWESIVALLRWAETYILKMNNTIQRHNNNNNENQCNLHLLFYTICQSAFYIMCFRGKEIMDWYQRLLRVVTKTSSSPTITTSTISHNHNDYDIVLLQQMNINIDRWSALCSNTLQPLKYCLESVRMEFLHLSKKYKWIHNNVLNDLYEYEQQRTIRLQRLQLYNNKNRYRYSSTTSRNSISSFNSTSSLFSPTITPNITRASSSGNINLNENDNNANDKTKQQQELLLEIQQKRKKMLLLRSANKKRLSSSSIISAGSTFSSSTPLKIQRIHNTNNNNHESSIENERISGGIGGLGHGTNPLDSFFPFDPYLLHESSCYIEPYYRHWKADDNDDNEEDEEQEEQEQEAIVTNANDSHQHHVKYENQNDADGNVDDHAPPVDVNEANIDNGVHDDDDNVSIYTTSTSTFASVYSTTEEYHESKTTPSVGRGRKRAFSEVSKATNNISSSKVSRRKKRAFSEVSQTTNNTSSKVSDDNYKKNTEADVNDTDDDDNDENNDDDLVIDSKTSQNHPLVSKNAELSKGNSVDENNEDEDKNSNRSNKGKDVDDNNNIHHENLIYFETNQEKENWTAAMNRIRSYSIENGSW